MEKTNVLEKFTDLGLSETTIIALKNKGFEEPTEIQKKTIPILLRDNKDIIAQAQTGTGKTAAFGLPLIELLKERSKHIQALILTPTRELAIQVSEEINSLKGNKNLQIVPIYGGQSIGQQLNRLERGVDIVVGTPGRILDYLNRKKLFLDKISFLILDEADEMLNMGFLEDVEKILEKTNSNKRMLLFSATMPSRIIDLSKRFMKEHDIVKVKKVELATNLTDQIYFEVNSADKFEALCRIVDIEEDFYGLIFCRTKKDADTISHRLNDRGYETDVLHGDISQSQREKTLDKFKKKQTNILVATDVAARGIDIQNLSHVINFSLPQDAESYVHRIGRTGRAGKKGIAITFITPDEYRKLMVIKKATKTDIRSEKLPNVEDIINIKRSRLKTEINNIIVNKENQCHLPLAEDILKSHSPIDALSALIQYTFNDELSETSYNEIRTINVDQKGKTRLFVALGKKDGMNIKSLVNLIKKQVHIDEKHIQEVKIFDIYSFITTPFKEAEIILKAFKMKNNGRPIIKRAKAKK
ncbi:MAG: DEAD/DEAH box helicase [Spirochaetota bacterium]|nr:DEAD/DEAH box helicase [Spirochaetota bacterium]